MSTLVLQAVGTAVGTVVGGPIGGLIGGALGSAAGGMVDSAILSRVGGSPTTRRSIEGPRLSAMPALASGEGAAIPRVYGRARIGGHIIWATRFEEQVNVQQNVTQTRARGGKGGGGRRTETVVTTTTTYSYFANLAVGLCEGEIAFVRRVWADGKPLDRSRIAMRVHRGGEGQQPDPLIIAKEGAAPAYRGLAYVVIERLPLAEWGNRLPQLSFEVVRPVHGLGAMIRAVNLMPGTGEFALDPVAVSRDEGLGYTVSENVHQALGGTDWTASLDALQALCPNLRRVTLIVCWFGSDLRAGSCTVMPRVETTARATSGATWSVAGLERGQAAPVSTAGGRPAYGGTPSDGSVIRALRDLTARGLAVTLHPFLLMDVPAGNGLPNPATGAPGQPAYPWRGRITCDPAPGLPGTPDGTAAAGAQVQAFIGASRANDFMLDGEQVVHAGTGEWTLSRQVLHCAWLARAAGGVEAMLIGSELVGVTRVRSAPGVYPAAGLLARLAAEVRLVLPSARISYAADWTEYGSHVPAPGELRFPLDPLWASPAIDAVAIDAWWPLTDWRDGPLHADAGLRRSVHDPALLLAGTASGEGYDWYYASPAERAAQLRRPIEDGAYGKPWVYRPKDLVGWWSNPHVERVGGVERPSPTPWTPRGKPIWLAEVGCGAVDKGANTPSSFPDPKSAEDGRPAFSDGRRDDLMLVRAVEAILTRFDPARPGHPAGSNPISPVYGGPMVDPSRIAVWAWDARPFPAFPDRADVWSDGASWAIGHWLTGRLESVALDRLIAAILAELDGPAAAQIAVDGWVDGFVIDRPMSARAALEPLADAFGFDALASGPALRFVERVPGPTLALAEDDLVPDREGALTRLTRDQESELPQSVALGFVDAAGDYASAALTARRLTGASRRAVAMDLPAVMQRPEAARLAERMLHEAWTGRERATFSVRPTLVALEPGDTVTLPGDGRRLWRIVRIRDDRARHVEARSVSPRAGTGAEAPTPRPASSAPIPDAPGRPFIQVIDWPAGRGDVLQSVAATASPWPGGLTLWRSVDGASFDPVAAIPAPSTVSVTLTALAPGPLWRWDRANVLDLRLSADTLAARGPQGALSGAASIAVQGPDGLWEVIAFSQAELIGPRTVRLSGLLRGLGGSEASARREVGAGAAAVAIDGTLVPIAEGVEALGKDHFWRIGPRGHDVAEAAVLAFRAMPTSAALRPLAPVRLRARRTPQGVLLSWLRRGRVNADGWDAAEIPLGEESEAYAVDILDGAAVKRALAVTTPQALYGAAEEAADFGGPQASLAVRVAQLSAAVGRGAAAEATLPIP